MRWCNWPWQRLVLPCPLKIGVRNGPVKQGTDERAAVVLHVLRGWMGVIVFCGFLGVAQCFDDDVVRGGVIGCAGDGFGVPLGPVVSHCSE